MEDYPAVVFQSNIDNETSVDVKKFKTKKKYNDDLKEFLIPILNNQQAIKMKKYGKKVKLYAQALGLGLELNETNIPGNRNNENSKRNENKKKTEKKAEVSKNKEIEKLNGIIVRLEDQVRQLTLMLKELYQRSLMPIEERNELVERIDQIRRQNPKEEGQMEDLENNIELHEEMQANVYKTSDLVYNYSINEIGKEKARNIAQCIETELEYSSQNKLG